MNEILRELSKILTLEDDGMGGTRVYAYVDPDMARKLLTLSGGNRPLSGRVVGRYRRHMEKGTWDESAPTQFITFNKQGVLTNGHHTLKALTGAGRPIKLYFMFNAPDSTYYDCGRRRSEADRFCMLDGGSRDGFTGYKRAISMCNVLTEVGLTNMLTEEERRQFILDHIKAFEWSTGNLRPSKRRLGTAPVRTAMLMGKLNDAPAHKLEHFWDVLQSGYIETPNDRSIIALRDWLVAQGDSRTKEYRREVLSVCVDTIRKWLEGKQVKVITPPAEMGEWLSPSAVREYAVAAAS